MWASPASCPPPEKFWYCLVLPGSPHSSESLELPGDTGGKGEGKQAGTGRPAPATLQTVETVLPALPSPGRLQTPGVLGFAVTSQSQHSALAHRWLR